MYFTVVVSSALPTPVPRAQIVIDTRETALSYEMVYPGGFGSLSVGLPTIERTNATGYLPRQGVQFQEQDHVQVFAGGSPRPCWEGQLVEIHEGAGGWVSGFVAEGYGISGLDDNPTLSTSTTLLSSGSLLASQVLGLSTYIQPAAAYWQEPGVQHSLSEFYGKAIVDIADQLSKEGNGEGTPWDFSVWEAIAVGSGTTFAPQAWFVPRTVPATIDYYDPWDSDGVTRVRNARKKRSGVYVTYGSNPASAATNIPYITELYTNLNYTGQVPRVACVDGGSIMTGTAAEAFAATYAQMMATSEVAVSIVRTLEDPDADVDQLRGLSTPFGGLVRPWWVRPGRWLQLLDQGPYLVTRVAFDAWRRQLQVKAGDYWVDSSDQWRELRDHARHQRRATHPVTGARIKH